MCSVTTTKVNDIGQKVSCKYVDTEIGMPVFMDNISAIANAREILKRIKNFKMEKLKKV